MLKVILDMSLPQKEMKMMKNGLFQNLRPISQILPLLSIFNLMPKSTESHFLPGHQQPTKLASRKTTLSQISDHKMSILVSLMETSILPKNNSNTNGTGPRLEPATKKIILFLTSAEMVTLTTLLTILTQLSPPSAPGTSQKMTGSDQNFQQPYLR